MYMLMVRKKMAPLTTLETATIEKGAILARKLTPEQRMVVRRLEKNDRKKAKRLNKTGPIHIYNHPGQRPWISRPQELPLRGPRIYGHFRDTLDINPELSVSVNPDPVAVSGFPTGGKFLLTVDSVDLVVLVCGLIVTPILFHRMGSKDNVYAYFKVLIALISYLCLKMLFKF